MLKASCKVIHKYYRLHNKTLYSTIVNYNHSSNEKRVKRRVGLVCGYKGTAYQGSQIQNSIIQL